MKKILFSVLLLCAAATGFAQCDKPVLLTSSKTQYLNTSGTVEHTTEEKTTVEIRKDSITITPGEAPSPMKGNITSQTCSWTVPYKEGKSVMKAKLTDPGSGQLLNLTITIEGKDGKVSLLAQIEELPDRQIRVDADSFAEKS